jgi:hypothetical protein
LQGILLETSISDPLAREFWGTCFSGKVNHPPLPCSVYALSRPNASSLTFACRGLVINQNEVELEVFQQSFYEFLGLPEPNKKNDVKCSCLLAILKELRMWILLLLLLHRVGANDDSLLVFFKTDEQNKEIVTIKTFSDMTHWFGPLEKGWRVIDRVRPYSPLL